VQDFILPSFHTEERRANARVVLSAILKELASQGKRFLDVELNTGQMLQDVKLAVGAGVTVNFLGRWGGLVPTEAEIENKLRRLEVVAA
jgi:pyruvate/2-oxoacid:ferredoxin oxidoreductase alpha subunit